MFTPNRLLEMSLEYEQQAADMYALSTPGVYSEHYNKAYDLRKKAMEALVCAEWMERHGITEAPMIGPFGNISAERGTKVRIKAGSVINGFGPEFAKGQKIIERPYTVNVHSVEFGYAYSPAWTGNRDIEVKNQRVEWVGSGGYWRWTDSSNVEICS